MSGLAEYVPLDQLQDRLVVMMCNLKPVNMRGAILFKGGSTGTPDSCPVVSRFTGVRGRTRVARVSRHYHARLPTRETTGDEPAVTLYTDRAE